MDYDEIIRRMQVAPRPEFLDLKTRGLGYQVSTVSLEGYYVMPYETMVFPLLPNGSVNYREVYSERFETRAEAIDAHHRIAGDMQAGKLPLFHHEFGEYIDGEIVQNELEG